MSLTASPAQDEHPVWSPTGTRIAYDDGGNHLRSVAADGTDVRDLGAGRPLDWRVVPVGKPHYPNLVQRPPTGLVTAGSRGRWLLGFTSMVDNRGPGILWIRGTRHGNAHVMNVRQFVTARRRRDAGAPRVGRAALHGRATALSLALPRLRPLRAAQHGRYKLLVRDHKSGFCIADHYGIALGVAHGYPRFLGSCAQFDPKARFVEEGSSVGYTDRYPANFHGQNLDITKVPRRPLLARAPREPRLPSARDALR